MSMSRAPLVFAISLAACASSGTAAKQESAPAAGATETAPPDQQDQGLDLQKVFARERPPMTKQKLEVAELGLVAEVEGTGPPKVERSENVHTINIPIGTEFEVSCVLRSERVDLSSSVTQMVKKAGEKVEIKAVSVVPAEIVGATPILGANAIYLVKKDDKPLAGSFKVRITSNAHGSLLCWHDEAGYDATFGRIVGQLARALDDRAEKQSRGGVRYLEVNIVKMNGIPIGFSEESLAPATDGGQLSQDVSGMLIARSQTDLSGQDSYEVVHADKDGRILEETQAEADNGELSMKLVARREKSRTYSYQGMYRSKDVSGRFETKSDLLLSFVHQKRFGALAKSGGPAEVSYEKYSPSSNLDGPTQVTIKTNPAGPGRYTTDEGELKIEGQLDEKGWPKSATLDMGRLILTLDRVFLRGEP